MPKCTFCGQTYEWPVGLTYVKTDGTVIFLCSGKCRKNMLMGRDKKKLKWIRKMKGAEDVVAEIKEAAEKKEEKK